MGFLNQLKDYWDTLKGQQYIDEAVTSYEGNNTGGLPDAYRHLLWTAEMTRKLGPEVARTVSNYHENTTIPFGLLGGASPLQSDEERQMDLYNNALGIQIGQNSQSYEDTMRLAKEAIARGDVDIIRGEVTPKEYFPSILK